MYYKKKMPKTKQTKKHHTHTLSLLGVRFADAIHYQKFIALFLKIITGISGLHCLFIYLCANRMHAERNTERNGRQTVLRGQ